MMRIDAEGRHFVSKIGSQSNLRTPRELTRIAEQDDEPYYDTIDSHLASVRSPPNLHTSIECMLSFIPSPSQLLSYHLPPPANRILRDSNSTVFNLSTVLSDIQRELHVGLLSRGITKAESTLSRLSAGELPTFPREETLCSIARLFLSYARGFLEVAVNDDLQKHQLPSAVRILRSCQSWLTSFDSFQTVESRALLILSTNLLGEALFMQGQNKEASAFFKFAAKLSFNLPPSSSFYRLSLLVQALTHYNLVKIAKQPENAMERLRAALNQLEKIERFTTAATATSTTTDWSYLEEGDGRRLLRNLQARCWFEIALVEEIHYSRFEDALRHFMRAVGISESFLGNTHPTSLFLKKHYTEFSSRYACEKLRLMHSQQQKHSPPPPPPPPPLQSQQKISEAIVFRPTDNLNRNQRSSILIQGQDTAHSFNFFHQSLPETKKKKNFHSQSNPSLSIINSHLPTQGMTAVSTPIQATSQSLSVQQAGIFVERPQIQVRRQRYLSSSRPLSSNSISSMLPLQQGSGSNLLQQCKSQSVLSMFEDHSYQAGGDGISSEKSLSKKRKIKKRLNDCEKKEGGSGCGKKNSQVLRTNSSKGRRNSSCSSYLQVKQMKDRLSVDPSQVQSPEGGSVSRINFLLQLKREYSKTQSNFIDVSLQKLLPAAEEKSQPPKPGAFTRRPLKDSSNCVVSLPQVSIRVAGERQNKLTYYITGLLRFVLSEKAMRVDVDFIDSLNPEGKLAHTIGVGAFLSSAAESSSLKQRILGEFCAETAKHLLANIQDNCLELDYFASHGPKQLISLKDTNVAVVRKSKRETELLTEQLASSITTNNSNSISSNQAERRVYRNTKSTGIESYKHSSSSSQSSSQAFRKDRKEICSEQQQQQQQQQQKDSEFAVDSKANVNEMQEEQREGGDTSLKRSVMLKSYEGTKEDLDSKQQLNIQEVKCEVPREGTEEDESLRAGEGNASRLTAPSADLPVIVSTELKVEQVAIEQQQEQAENPYQVQSKYGFSRSVAFLRSRREQAAAVGSGGQIRDRLQEIENAFSMSEETGGTTEYQQQSAKNSVVDIGFAMIDGYSMMEVSRNKEDSIDNSFQAIIAAGEAQERKGGRFEEGLVPTIKDTPQSGSSLLPKIYINSMNEVDEFMGDEEDMLETPVKGDWRKKVPSQQEFDGFNECGDPFQAYYTGHEEKQQSEKAKENAEAEFVKLLEEGDPERLNFAAAFIQRKYRRKQAKRMEGNQTDMAIDEKYLKKKNNETEEETSRRQLQAGEDCLQTEKISSLKTPSEGEEDNESKVKLDLQIKIQEDEAVSAQGLTEVQGHVEGTEEAQVKVAATSDQMAGEGKDEGQGQTQLDGGMVKEEEDSERPEQKNKEKKQNSALSPVQKPAKKKSQVQAKFKLNRRFNQQVGFVI